MSSNVGLSTPRGSGTSGYVQRNYAFVKPRNAGYGAPYPPVSSSAGELGRPFKQRQPDKQILEHDRRRVIEVKVMEERERLEDENERIEVEQQGNGKKEAEKDGDGHREEKKILSEEEIDERCEALREKLLLEMEEADDEARNGQQGNHDYSGSEEDAGRGKKGGVRLGGRDFLPPKERRQFKSYQVHEQAEAKIEESERLRKALGIKEDKETGELSSGRGYSDGRRRDWTRERY
ncbi:hypothetical protein EYZ11_008529 [Aspergillus tanneri]|uniref:RNA-splicing factor n=1 Tax=Aspergillus tanneri TaxID=1220188 RepID=A0A4S3JA80_9EURO|nr:RNA-splicing factor [Aspergillus tanneri]KAA8643273.1 RNA-splicing factor [Aspergillus tanneri]THC91999.1 hypothetical protein EYZ11_008529 [Aspergillus tanneri]